jgi:hypothetical protein
MKAHDQLFKSYVDALRGDKSRAEGWWQTLLEAETSGTGDRDAAERNLRQRWPFGPASHPWVIATYRRCFLECDRINRSVDASPEPVSQSADEGWGTNEPSRDDGPITPRVLLVDLLSGGPNEDLYKFILPLVFVPIGQKNGEFV